MNYLKIFHSFGCINIFIVGSFTTNKNEPEDIDICVDMTYMKYYEFEKANPDMVIPKGIYKILDKQFIHIVTYFDNYTIESLNWFRKDKKDNKRGIIKVILNDIASYD